MKSIAKPVTEIGYRDEVIMCEACFRIYVNTIGLDNSLTIEETTGPCELCGPIETCLAVFNKLQS